MLQGHWFLREPGRRSKGADPQARRPAFAVVRARPGLAASTVERPALSFCQPHPLRRHGVDLKRGNVLMSVILFSAASAATAASAGMEPVITVHAVREQELSHPHYALPVLVYPLIQALTHPPN